jgi:hypothetical protein
MSVLRGLFGGSVLSLSLEGGSHRRWAGRQAGSSAFANLLQISKRSSLALRPLIPTCFATSLSMSLVCVFHCGSLRLFALLFLPICAC